MSVMNRRCVKVLLPRDPSDFWAALNDHYPNDRESWRRFAMLALRENAHWSLHRIARAFGRPRKDVIEAINHAKRDLRRRFTDDPDQGVPAPDTDPRAPRRDRREIRNPKLEIRNKPEAPKPQTPRLQRTSGPDARPLPPSERTHPHRPHPNPR